MKLLPGSDIQIFIVFVLFVDCFQTPLLPPATTETLSSFFTCLERLSSQAADQFILVIELPSSDNFTYSDWQGPQRSQLGDVNTYEFNISD